MSHVGKSHGRQPSVFTSDYSEKPLQSRLMRNGRAFRSFWPSRTILEALASFELPILKNGTNQRVIYAEALTGGTTVVEMQPYGEATYEIKRILKEIRV
jgi:hypothetical protein